MAVIRTILKSSADANGRHQVLLMLSERGTRAYFTTGFTASLGEFDASKDGADFIREGECVPLPLREGKKMAG